MSIGANITISPTVAEAAWRLVGGRNVAIHISHDDQYPEEFWIIEIEQWNHALPDDEIARHVVNDETCQTREWPYGSDFPFDIEREPTDHEIYNGYGMEGGIAYDPSDSRSEHDRSL